MKNAAKTPGKLLAGLCLILFFCLMPGPVLCSRAAAFGDHKTVCNGNLWQRNTAAAESQLAVCR